MQGILPDFPICNFSQVSKYTLSILHPLLTQVIGVYWGISTQPHGQRGPR
jgi:hypothetical protein